VQFGRIGASDGVSFYSHFSTPYLKVVVYLYILDNLAYEFKRPGDLARIEENISSSGPSKKATKIKKPEDAATKPKAAEGVVYKVTAISIILILSA